MLGVRTDVRLATGLGREILAVSLQPSDHPQQREVPSQELRTWIFTTAPLEDELTERSLVFDEVEADFLCAGAEFGLEFVAGERMNSHRHDGPIPRTRPS